MQLLFVDFETYYDTDFNLTSAKSTGEYIGTTQLQLMSYAINHQPVRRAVGEQEIRDVLSRVDWGRTALVSHNGSFDARIVLERLGHKAVFYFDTLAMMRSLRWDVIFGGAKLSHLSKVLQGNGLSIADKGDEVAEAKGNYLFKFKNGQWYMHPTEITAEYLERINLTPSGKKRTGKAVKDPRKIVTDAIDLYRRFSEYCDNDVEICRAGFYEMVKLLSKDELKYQDMILRCVLEPKLKFDLPLLKDALKSGKEKVRDAVRPIADKWYHGDMQSGKDALLSTGKLAITMKAMGGMTQDEVDDHIARYGVDPEPAFIIPTKVSEKKSAKAGRSVYDYALAKKDPGMVELMTNPYPDLQELMASRRTVVYYNNYELPRLERFINEMEYMGIVGMPLKVSGAFTHRLGGSVFNIQNMSSGRNEGQEATLRKSIIAPDDQVIIGADSSQIEARVLAFMANETIILEEFRNGIDPYCAMAEKIYGVPADEINRRRKDPNDPHHEEASLWRQAGKAARLGLGYSMGAQAFVDYAATLGVTITLEESRRIVNVYRTTYAQTSGLWDMCKDILTRLVGGESGYFGGPDGKLFYFDGSRFIGGKRVPGIRLPDGMWLNYTELQMRERTYPNGDKAWNFCYYGIDAGMPMWTWIYGGKVVENLCQALAFAIMKYQAMLIHQRYRIAFNVHDEWVTVSPEAEAEVALQYVVGCMKQLPTWATGCPIDAEGTYAKSYGDC